MQIIINVSVKMYIVWTVNCELCLKIRINHYLSGFQAFKNVNSAPNYVHPSHHTANHPDRGIGGSPPPPSHPAHRDQCSALSFHCPPLTQEIKSSLSSLGDQKLLISFLPSPRRSEAPSIFPCRSHGNHYLHKKISGSLSLPCSLPTPPPPKEISSSLPLPCSPPPRGDL